MGVYSGPDINENGLVLALDGANLKSFKGEATTNLISNPTEEMSRGEFGQYRDLASIFDTNGLTPYSLSMDIKTNIPGNVFVYMQNGSYTKYNFVSNNAYCTTEYQRFYFTNITPSISSAWQQNTPNDNRAILATYTGYGSGINPTVKNIQLEQKSYSTNFVAGTRGSTVATGGGWADLSGRGNNGELVNGVRESSVNGGALVFDGVDDYVNISVPTSINAKTILSFIRVTASGGDYIVYGLDANGSDNWFGVNGNVVHLFGTQISDVNNFSLFGTTNILTNTWYQIGCTIDGATAKVFLNGVQENSITQAFTIGAWSSSPTIGRRGSIAQRYFPGNIANLQVYDRALTASEIQQNYNATKSRYGL